MTYEAPIIAIVLFWAFATGVLFLPLDLAIPAYLLIAEIDMSGPEFTATSSIGYQNLIKIMVLPVVLICRIGWHPVMKARWPSFARTWCVLIVYALVSTAWSDYRLSAIKMLGYLSCFAMLVIIFTFAWSAGWITERALVSVAWCSCGMAAVQTYLLGDPFSDIEGRFTTFGDPTSFAVFSVALLALLLFGCSTRWRTRATEVLLVVAIVLTGSRYVFLATVLLFLAYSLLTLARRRQGLSLRGIVQRAFIGALPALLLVGLIVYYFPSSRLDELFVSSSSNSGVEEIGTLAWRFSVYEEAINQLEQRNVGQLLVGSGTGTSGKVLLALGQDEDTLDPNRSMHDEFLHALYDWGFIGFVLMVGFFVQLVIASLRQYRAHRSWQAMACLGLFPAILFGLASENILTTAGQAGGTAYALMLGGLISSIMLSHGQVFVARPFPGAAALGLEGRPSPN
jgi:O-antigen ligase